MISTEVPCNLYRTLNKKLIEIFYDKPGILELHPTRTFAKICYNAIQLKTLKIKCIPRDHKKY
jgi:hypothetical protein